MILLEIGRVKALIVQPVYLVHFLLALMNLTPTYFYCYRSSYFSAKAPAKKLGI